jgi:hypothetical protein
MLSEIVQGHELAIIVALMWAVAMLTMFHLMMLIKFLCKDAVRRLAGESKYPNEYEDPKNLGSH